MNLDLPLWRSLRREDTLVWFNIEVAHTFFGMEPNAWHGEESRKDLNSTFYYNNVYNDMNNPFFSCSKEISH